MRLPLLSWMAAALLLPRLIFGDDAFLDRHIPTPPEIKSQRYLDYVRALQKAVGKPVIFPDGLMDYVVRKNPEMGWRFFNSQSPKTIAMRDYLRVMQANLGLKATYDKQRDAVVMDFFWHVQATHSGPELIQLLLKNVPVEPKGPSFDSHLLDPWTHAFNELLSRPENFANGGKIRVMQGFVWLATGDFYGCEIHQGYVNDDSGHKHFMVLAVFPPMMTPGPPPHVVCYLFDENGKLEDGGTFDSGSTFNPATYKVSPQGDGFEVETVFKWTNHFEYNASLDGGKVETSKSGYLNMGTPSVSYDASTKTATLEMNSKFTDTYVLKLQPDRGKLKGTLFKNGVAVVPLDYKGSWMSPLVDLLD